MTQKSWFFKHRIMPKIIHHFFSLTFFLMLCVSSAFGAGYTCPTNRQYTTCNEGYYLAHSYTGTSYSDIKYDSTPRAGNACRPCTDYDNHYNRPEGSYYCEGKTKAPVLTTVRIIYNLNGGSGTTPDDETCKEGQPCTLNDGATTTFYRAGYVFKGWALTSDATSGFTSYTFTVVDVVYAVWEPCGIGKYKPGSGTQAAAACSSCPDLPTGFAYASTTGLKKKTECSAAAVNVGLLNENCRDEITSAPVRLRVGAEDDTDWTLYYTVPTTASMIRANPGAYVNPEILTEGIWQPYSNFNADELCKLCQDGTYNGNMSQTVTSCTACPSITATDEQVGWKISTGGTGATSWEACYTYWNRHPSTCATGGYKREAISAGGYQEGMLEDPENPFTAIPGYYVTYTGGTGVGPTCVECSAGTYSPGGDVHSCSPCPKLTPGFEYLPTTGNTSLTKCRQGIAKAEDVNEYCAASSEATEQFDIQCDVTPDGTWGDCTIGNAWTAKPGSYVGIWKQAMPAEDVIENLCIQCGVGTYSEGGQINSCSRCPELTTGFEYLPTTGNTSLTKCIQGLKNPANINEFCETPSSATAGTFKIRCVAASDDTWGNCVPTGAPFDAKPGSYVGITSQSQPMPIEDVVENICKQCKDGTWSYGEDVTSCSACPALRPADEQAGWKISSGGDGATRVQDCYAYLESYPTNCASGSFKRMYRGDAAAGYYESQWFEWEPLTAKPGYMVQFENGQTTAPACVECSEGTYSPGGDVHSCSDCPSGYDDNPETGLTSAAMCQISCPGGYYLAAANDATCSEVSPGYWAAEKIVNYGDTSTRTECASGLTTIGYGAGADEAADCGRVLHFGNDTLYLRSVKKTDHALHVGINGTVFYGNMGTDLSKSGLRIKLGDTTYSVYDDSM